MKRLLFSLLALSFLWSAGAQPIPDDPEIRVGRLANGMTYYLCHNETPAGRAEFYIAHHVGALQEEDNQNGLAHFLEHMAFNGTKHYPDKGILDFLAKEGVRFGYNVNAYTSKTETVYNLSEVPLVRNSFVDSVLMVLHDWSCDISCEQQALDDERGVISEEWRLGQDSRSRMALQQTNLIYKGSKQTERTVIGTLEVINGFKRDEILDFYHKWYRPDLQALIIVGDFDVDEMDGRIRTLFSDIPVRVNPEPKQEYVPPVQAEPLFGDMTDPEIRYQAYKALYKQRCTVTDRREEAFYKDYLCRMIVSSVVADRFRERSKEKGSPVQNATMVTNAYKPDMYVSLATVVPKKKEGLEDCLRFTEREVQRLLRHGISPDELEIAKLNVSSRMHLDAEKDRSEVKNSEIVQMALGHFLLGAPLVLPETLQDVRRSVLASITAEDIAPYPEQMFGACEKIYSNCYNDTEKSIPVPTAEQMRQALAEVDAEETASRYLSYPRLDLTVDAVPGTVRSVSKVKGTDMECWTLSNGVRVYYKESAPVRSGSHLSMTLLFDTGYAAFEPERVTASRYALNYDKRNTGFRGFEKPEMKNCPELSGVAVMLGGNSSSGRIDITARKDRVENAFKAAYLQLTDPCFGSERLLQQQKTAALKSLGKKKSPKNLFDERCRKETYGDHPWMHEIDSMAVEATDLALLEDVYRRYYGDIPEMKVVLCTDQPKEEILPLVERYLASLNFPYPYTKGKYLPSKPVVKGMHSIEESHAPVSAPFTEISYNWYYKGGRTPRERAAIDVLDYILSARYLALIREERGGAYSVQFCTATSNEAAVPTRSYVDFQTRPEIRDLLLSDVQEELARMCADGPTPEELDLAVKYLVKHHDEQEDRIARSVSLQEDRMVGFVRWGTPYGYDYEKLVRSLRCTDIRALARRITGGDKIVEVYNEE
jgi:zinc protease